jgi:hypothetical protein
MPQHEDDTLFEVPPPQTSQDGGDQARDMLHMPSTGDSVGLHASFVFHVHLVSQSPSEALQDELPGMSRFDDHEVGLQPSVSDVKVHCLSQGTESALGPGLCDLPQDGSLVGVRTLDLR